MDKNNFVMCACGCGTLMSKYGGYIKGHNFRNKSFNRKYTINHDALSVLTCESKYIIGFIAGDGCPNIKYKTLRIHLSKKDKNHLIKVNNFFGSNAPIHETSYSVGLTLSSSKIIDVITSYGIHVYLL